MPKEKTKPKKEKKKEDIGGLLIAAGLFIGMGIGGAFGNFLPGLFIGLGVGLLASAIYHYRKERK